MLVGALEGAVEKAKPAVKSAGNAAQKNSNPLLMFIPLVLLGAFFAYKHLQQ